MADEVNKASEIDSTVQDPNTEVKDRASIVGELASSRPDSEKDLLVRQLHIQQSMNAKLAGILAKRGIDQKKKEQDPNLVEKIKQRFDEVIPSVKKISEYVEPEYIIAANLMYEDPDLT